MNDRSITPSYGPDNPHPLSHMKTELVWEGKYTEKGKHQICVKVIDVFGIDTTTVIEVLV